MDLVFSRREFLLAPATSPLKSVPGKRAGAFESASAVSESQGLGHEREPLEDCTLLHECSECRGLGKVICLACDGTRAARRCAWCDDFFEVGCIECEGIGIRPSHARHTGGTRNECFYNI